VQSNTECLSRMTVETARQFERCPLKSCAYLRPHRQLSPVTASALPCPIPLTQAATGEQPERCIYSRAPGPPRLGMTPCMKSNNIGTWIKRQARHTELSCVSWSRRSSGSTQKKRKKQQRKSFPIGQPGEPQLLTRRCRQLSCATHQCGMPATG